MSLDLVKFTFTNQHGATLGPDWKLIPHDAGDEPAAYPRTTASLRTYLKSGRPYLEDFTVVERIELPEEIRQTGQASLALSHCILYRNARGLTGEELIAAMKEELL